MNTIRRISEREIRRSVSPAHDDIDIPAGSLPPVLKPSWGFAKDMSRRFSRELVKDRVKDFLNKLIKRFV